MTGRQQRYNVTMVDNSKRIDELKKELARDSRSRQFYQLGELLRRDGRLNEAADVLRAGLKHHARYVAAWVALGRTCLDLGHGREGEAADALAQALGLDAHNPVAWRLLGEARLACGQRGAALEAMERALALVPGDEVLKAAVEALQAEAAPPAPVLERRPAAAAPPEPRPQPAPMEPALPEVPFAFEAAPLELDAAVGPAVPAPAPQEPGGEVGASPAEGSAGEPGPPEPVVAGADQAPSVPVPAEQAPPTEAPFRDEAVSVEVQAAPLPVEAVPDSGPSADVFDVFGGPSEPEAADAVERTVAAAPVEPLPEPMEEPTPLPAEPEPVAELEPEPPGSPEAAPLPAESGPPEVAAAEVSAAEPTPELEPAPVDLAPPAPEAPMEEPLLAPGAGPEGEAEEIAPGTAPEGQPEELAPLELPAEPLSVAPEPGSPEEEAPAVAPVEVSLAEPDVAAAPAVVLVPESGQPEEPPRVVAAEEPPVEPEAVEGGTGGDLEPEASDARPLNPPEVEESVVREAPGPAAVSEESPASITLARLYLHQQQMDAAVEVLERLLAREPDNQEAGDLLVLVRDLMEEAPAPQVPVLPVSERKIAALQRWLARMEPGRERMTR